MIIKRVYKDTKGEIFDVEINIKTELKFIYQIGMNPDDVFFSIITDTDKMAKEIYDAIPYEEDEE
jgi:hypothetical protein